MRIMTVIIAALATLAVATPSIAQMSNKTKASMDTMRQQDATSFNTCRTLALSRGYNESDKDDAETGGMALMNFVKGCMMSRAK
jgi:hypothetical protein